MVILYSNNQWNLVKDSKYNRRITCLQNSYENPDGLKFDKYGRLWSPN